MRVSWSVFVRRQHASINDLRITEAGRKQRWERTA